MRLKPLQFLEYDNRISKLQKELKKKDLDVFIGYSSECESATSRFLTGFWPFFDFASVVIPAEGKAILVTGGPESFDFAKAFSCVTEICINPLLVETSSPTWAKEVYDENFSTILAKACGYVPKRIGIGNWNIFPYILFENIKKAFPNAEYIPADEILWKIQAVKSEAEIPYIIEAYRITEEAMKAALEAAEPGKMEWELEAVARSKMVMMGAEGLSYPAWVCSGSNTRLSLCRSTNRCVKKNELIQLAFGAKYMGYCGNMCRPFSIGKAPKSVIKLMDAALEAMNYTLKIIAPGIPTSQIFDGYYEILARYGFENCTLYGPAHGTGSSEVEGLWISKEADFTIQQNMVFNVDIWLSDGENGLRYEDGILVTETGIKELTSYRREVIVL